MRIAFVHSFYRSDVPSGENVAVLQQAEALERGGVEIVEIFRSTDVESVKPLHKTRSAIHLATGIDGGRLGQHLRRARVDLVHVHNLWPNFGTRWLKQLKLPVVATAHNFRYACANGLLFRDGVSCVECPTSGSWAAVRHRCYQDSVAASIPAALATFGGVQRNPVVEASRVLITQSKRVHDFMLAQGLAKSRLAYIPGFVEEPSRTGDLAPRVPRFVFVGRPTPEKGLRELLGSWPSNLQLDVFGASADEWDPLPGSVTFRGYLDRDELLKRLPHYTALVFPGMAWEGAYPLVVREAMAAGLPVVAREGTGAADLILESRAGAVYEAEKKDSLTRALVEVIERNVVLRREAHSFFQDQLSEQRWLTEMLRAYQGAMRGAGTTARTRPIPKR